MKILFTEPDTVFLKGLIQRRPILYKFSYKSVAIEFVYCIFLTKRSDFLWRIDVFKWEQALGPGPAPPPLPKIPNLQERRRKKFKGDGNQEKRGRNHSTVGNIGKIIAYSYNFNLGGSCQSAVLIKSVHFCDRKAGRRDEQILLRPI